MDSGFLSVFLDELEQRVSSEQLELIGSQERAVLSAQAAHKPYQRLTALWRKRMTSSEKKHGFGIRQRTNSRTAYAISTKNTPTHFTLSA